MAEEADDNNICDSTEDMIAHTRKANVELRKTENHGKQFVVGSYDVVALYPSCKIDESAKIIGDLVADSDVDIAVDTEELSMYLVSNMTQAQVDMEGWTDCCHSRAGIGGRRPGITTKEIVGDRGNGETKWRKPDREPSDVEKKAMVGKMVEIGTKVVMRNNLKR